MMKDVRRWVAGCKFSENFGNPKIQKIVNKDIPSHYKDMAKHAFLTIKNEGHHENEGHFVCYEGQNGYKEGF